MLADNIKNLILEFRDVYESTQIKSREVYDELKINQNRIKANIERYNNKNNIPETFKNREKFIYVNIPYTDLYLALSCNYGANMMINLECVVNKQEETNFYFRIYNEKIELCNTNNEVIFKIALDEYHRTSFAGKSLKTSYKLYNENIENVYGEMESDYAKGLLQIVAPKNQDAYCKVIDLVNISLDSLEKTFANYITFLQEQQDNEVLNLI